jgi:pSer/pThr/pTyr-binding forkhead associated (FHA) protein
MSFLICFNSLTENTVIHTAVIDFDTSAIVGRDDPTRHPGPFVYLDSKVVSRTHAKILVSETGKTYIQDTKSSSGSFVNSIRLAPPKTQSALVELKDGDFIQFGEDCEVNGQSYRCEIFRIGISPLESSQKKEERPGSIDSNNIAAERELQEIWTTLTTLQQNENPFVYFLLDKLPQESQRVSNAS